MRGIYLGNMYNGFPDPQIVYIAAGQEKGRDRISNKSLWIRMADICPQFDNVITSAIEHAGFEGINYGMFATEIMGRKVGLFQVFPPKRETMEAAFDALVNRAQEHAELTFRVDVRRVRRFSKELLKKQSRRMPCNVELWLHKENMDTEAPYIVVDNIVSLKEPGFRQKFSG